MNNRCRHVVSMVVLISGLIAAVCLLRSDSISTPAPVDPPPALQPVLARLRSESSVRQEARLAEYLDPQRDGWSTETFAERSQGLIDYLVRELVTTSPDRRKIESVLAPDFRCGDLRPPDLRQLFQSESLTVWDAPHVHSPNERSFSGVDGLRLAMRELFGSSTDRMKPRIHVKTIDVQQSASAATTTHEIEIFFETDSQATEQHFRWRCDWDPSTSEAPTLQSIHPLSFQESIRKASSGYFRDDTASVLGRADGYLEQLRFGLNHWLRRIPVVHGMYIFAEYGLAIGDVNGDGREDLYVCQAGGLPNRLLVQNSDGTATDISAAAGVDWLDHSSSALFVDLDNDGDQDLWVAIENHRVLAMRNDGTGRFQLAAELLIEDRHVQGLCSADFDNDGDLDIYLTVGFADERARPTEVRPAFVYHDANEGGANILFRNDSQHGDWRFTDVTKEVGLDVHNRRHSLAAAWEDFDNDGDQDLYVANDYGQNCLYRNDGGKFQDIATEAGVADFGSGMSVSWSDFDLDGQFDLYVGNMFSSAGNRITGQPRFRADASAETRSVLRRFAKGNSLFRNLGNGRFADVGHDLGVEMGRWAWSSLFADLNNDGWDDILVANGYISTDDARDL